MESSPHQIQLIDASLDEVKQALISSPASPVDFRYIMNAGGRVWEVVIKKIELPLRHHKALEDEVDYQVAYLRRSINRTLRMIQGEAA